MAEDDPFAQLAAALRERLRIIADRELRESNPSAQLDQLKEVSEKITQLSASLPPPLDPQFAHYLQRGSYDKALAWMERL